MSYGGGCGVPPIKGGLGCVCNGYMGDCEEGESLLGKDIYKFSALDMHFVCGVRDELYNYFNEELVWAVPLGCGAAYVIRIS